MGMKANSGFFNGTSGKRAIGDTSFMGDHQNFLKFISKRKDIDANGYYDVIAHGTETYIQFEQNNRTYDINWRTVTKLLKKDKAYKGGPIRLLSCNTGKNSHGFAQNLANKLGVKVKAPIGYVVAYDNGSYYVAEKHGNCFKKIKNGFKTFYPQRRKNK